MELRLDVFAGEWPEQYVAPTSDEACPVCGTPGARYVSHVCMTAGVPSYDPALDAGNQRSKTG